MYSSHSRPKGPRAQSSRCAGKILYRYKVDPNLSNLEPGIPQKLESDYFHFLRMIWQMYEFSEACLLVPTCVFCELGMALEIQELWRYVPSRKLMKRKSEYLWMSGGSVFCLGCWGWNSGKHACQASSLPLGHPPSPHRCCAVLCSPFWNFLGTYVAQTGRRLKITLSDR